MLPAFYMRRRHGEHQTRVQRLSRHHPANAFATIRIIVTNKKKKKKTKGTEKLSLIASIPFRFLPASHFPGFVRLVRSTYATRTLHTFYSFLPCRLFTRFTIFYKYFFLSCMLRFLSLSSNFFLSFSRLSFPLFL